MNVQMSYFPSYETFTPVMYTNGQTAVNGFYPVEGAQYGMEDERFFGFGILPFVAGLAIAPLLFNRPCCPPPFPPYPYPYPYPSPYPLPFPPSPYAAPAPYPPPVFTQQNITPIYGGLTENINIMTNAQSQGR